jgi:hypothetical protein
MITASKSQTSVSDSNLLKMSFEDGATELLATDAGLNLSRDPQLVGWGEVIKICGIGHREHRQDWSLIIEFGPYL